MAASCKVRLGALDGLGFPCLVVDNNATEIAARGALCQYSVGIPTKHDRARFLTLWSRFVNWLL